MLVSSEKETTHTHSNRRVIDKTAPLRGTQFFYLVF